MANGDVAPDMSQNGLDLMGILKALSVAPKTPPETAALNPKQFSVAPQTPQRATLDTSVPPRTAAEPKAPQQPEDQTQKMMEMFNAILGHVPQVNVPTNRRPSDWIMGAVAPLATGLATAMSGPRYKVGRNFVAGLASTAPQAVAGLLDAKPRRELQQQELNQKRFAEAGNILRSFSPFLRTPQGMKQVFHPDTNETTWEYNAQAAGEQTPPKATPRTRLVSGYVDGKPINAYFDEKQKRLVDTETQEPISGLVKTQGIVRPAEWVRDEHGNYGHIYRDQQDTIAKVEYTAPDGSPILPPPGYADTVSNTQRVVTINHPDGTIEYALEPITTVTKKQFPGAGSQRTGSQASPASKPKPQGSNRSGATRQASDGTKLTGPTPRIFAVGGRKDTEQPKADVTESARSSINETEKTMKGKPVGEKQQYALDDWAAIVDAAREDQSSQDPAVRKKAEHLLAISKDVQSAIKQQYPLPKAASKPLAVTVVDTP